MKIFCTAIGISGLLVVTAWGQDTKPGNGTNQILGLLPSTVATQKVAQASNDAPAAVAAAVTTTPAPAAVAQPAPAATATVAPVVVTPAHSQVVARVTMAVVATPFMTNFTARTAAGISNALVRWDAVPADRAVLAVLNWLRREQQKDGSWKGAKEIATPTLTALSLLAYLGHGETPASAAYGTNVSKAISWLLANQDAKGQFKGRDERNYTQPIAALALAEAYGMTLDPDVKTAAENAIKVIVKGQHTDGGFCYNLAMVASNNTSYINWCAQALVAARMAGLTVPGLDRVIDNTSYALRKNADPQGGFGEAEPGQTGFSSAGVAGLQFLGAPHVTDAQKTLELLATKTFGSLIEEPLLFPGASRFYGAWNLTQARFQAGEESFRAWNKYLTGELVENQTIQRSILTGWRDLGRWERKSAKDPKEVVIQDACYGALMLEVYYRYLPFGK